MKKKIVTFTMLATMLFSAVGCGGVGIQKGGKEGTLYLNVYSAGYGTAWIDEAARLFQEDNPGVEVEIETSPLAFSSVQTMLENGNCTDDIILVGANNYRQFVAKGYLEDLSDMYENVIPDSEKKVKEVVVEGAYEKYTSADGKIYGIPWQENYPAGLVYNKKMFAQYGWDADLPETMDEFFKLCDKIVTDTQGAVTPLTFGGADGDGYMFTNFPQWLMEYYGYDEFMKLYTGLDSPAVYENQEAGRKKVYEMIARITKGKTSNGLNIALAGSEGATAITAQTNFVNGQVAMVVNGTWFPNEMKEYLALKNFEIGYLPMPHINADKKSGDGTIDTSDVRYSSDNGVMAIPATATNKDLAKQFLTHMLTSKSYTSFVKSTNGLLRPLRGIEVDASSFNAFTKSAYEYFVADGDAKTNYAYPTDLFETDRLNVLYAYQGAFFAHITSQATYEKALEVAQGCYANELSYVYDRWDASKKEWK